MSIDRITRVNELLKREISSAFYKILAPEERVDMAALTVTHVTTSRNLRHARVLISILVIFLLLRVRVESVELGARIESSGIRLVLAEDTRLFHDHSLQWVSLEGLSEVELAPSSDDLESPVRDASGALQAYLERRDDESTLMLSSFDVPAGTSIYVSSLGQAGQYRVVIEPAPAVVEIGMSGSIDIDLEKNPRAHSSRR